MDNKALSEWQTHVQALTFQATQGVHNIIQEQIKDTKENHKSLDLKVDSIYSNVHDIKIGMGAMKNDLSSMDKKIDWLGESTKKDISALTCKFEELGVSTSDSISKLNLKIDSKVAELAQSSQDNFSNLETKINDLPSVISTSVSKQLADFEVTLEKSKNTYLTWMLGFFLATWGAIFALWALK